MPNYPRPKSSIPKKIMKSSLHPHGAPGVTETLEGLKRNLSKLGMHLAGAAMGIAGNLTGALQNLKRSAEEGDENSEQAYQEALEMLRASGSSTADSLLRDLGEELGEEPGKDEDTSAEVRITDAALPDREPAESTEADEERSLEMADADMVRVEKANESAADLPEDESAPGATLEEVVMEGNPAIRPEDSIRDNKVVCLECGKEFRQLTHTHLSTHGLSLEVYKGKYRLPVKMQLTAKSRTNES